jgi:hopanoid-associated phosphorylase
VTLLAAVGMQSEARIVAGPGVCVAVGGGREDVLFRALNQAMDQGVKTLISLGIAGGLTPELEVGDAVLGTEVVGDEGLWPTSSGLTDALAAALPHARRGAVWGSATMVLDAEQKARLHQTSNALAVDMESRIAARFARDHGLDFVILRVVSDMAATSLPSAVLDGLKPDGNPNLFRVLKGLTRRPYELPGLIRLGRDSETALKALREAWTRVGPALAP